MYEIIRVINNNMVSSSDEMGREVLLRGCGIGFGKKPHEKVDNRKIEKIYRISSHSEQSKFETLMSEYGKTEIELADKIIEYAKSILQQKISDSIYVSLTDHIAFSIKRGGEEQFYNNPILWEIKEFYPTEFQVGEYARNLLKEELGLQLPEDEAGFIALHIVNAELDSDMNQTMCITEMIQEVIQIVRESIPDVMDEESYDFYRFLSHLKYLGQRLFSQDEIKYKEDPQLQEIIRSRYPDSYQIAEKISKLISTKYHKQISEEEKMYLTIYLTKINMDVDS